MWTLITGFLVMFMQAVCDGETGLIGPRTRAHFAMNFMV
jgi:hypothetical protein